ncbi:MAG TPA: class I SAM-dependent methyltransferase [Acidobacteriota bacterium]|nr:class I SAM-dependent methyltransferase [Acidobacteriota bacterium]
MPQPRCPLCGSGESLSLCKAPDRQSPQRPRPRWEVRRCRQCGIGWTHPQPTPEQIRQAYPSAYLGDTEKTMLEFRRGKLQKSRSWRNETDKVRHLERHLQRGRILDVGCADGKFLWALDPQRWQRCGLEFLEETVGLVSREMPGLQLTAGRLGQESLPESSFDAVTLWHVLEHLPRPPQALQRLNALLKPGGFLLLAVPNLDSLQARLFARHWMGLDVPRHLFHYSPHVLSKLVEDAGFTLVEQRFQSSPVNIHHIKHSLLEWSLHRFSSRLPYYLLKWSVFCLNWAERLSARYGMLLIVARKKADMRDLR